MPDKIKKENSEAPKEKGVCDIYNKIAEAYSADFKEPSAHIDEFLKLVPKGGNILDVGAGVGVDSNYMQSKGFEVISIDFSEGMLKKAKDNFPQLKLLKQDMRDINLPPNIFDGIVSSYSLIHIPKKDIPNIFKKFNTILKKNGVVYLCVKKGESGEIFVDEPYIPGKKLFLNVMSDEEIKDLFKRNHFAIEQSYADDEELMASGSLGLVNSIIIARKITDLNAMKISIPK